MSEEQRKVDQAGVDELYAEAEHWHVNTGGETIHAKRVPGKWRNVKWLGNAVWLIFFLGPYLRWDGRQAVLFDIPERQFHIFGLTILPQDFWMLSLLLLFFALLLAVSTALVGRVWCGFFCFQTVWTDIYTWIEDKLEGNPQQRRKLEKAPLDARKLRIKLTKHALWLIIAVLTGVSFAAWFTDAFVLWGQIATLQASTVVWVVMAMFTGGTYLLAGFMREQACFWLCPYARIQGVMVDKATALPTYDYRRGEPRGRVKKGESEANRTTGDCIDCNQCVAVCPTGVDIRQGQQEGCITCALCLDACDTVMDKLGRDRGLIRYMSLEELEGKRPVPLWKRGRVWVYTGIMSIALAGVVYGISTISSLELKVLHERQPLFVLQSDGSVQNKYTLKILNKTNFDMDVVISAEGLDDMVLVGADEPVTAQKSGVTATTVFLRVPREELESDSESVVFHIHNLENEQFSAERQSVFVGPRR